MNTVDRAWMNRMSEIPGVPKALARGRKSRICVEEFHASGEEKCEGERHRVEEYKAQESGPGCLR